MPIASAKDTKDSAKNNAPDLTPKTPVNQFASFPFPFPFMPYQAPPYATPPAPAAAPAAVQSPTVVARMNLRSSPVDPRLELTVTDFMDWVIGRHPNDVEALTKAKRIFQDQMVALEGIK